MAQDRGGDDRGSEGGGYGSSYGRTASAAIGATASNRGLVRSPAISPDRPLSFNNFDSYSDVHSLSQSASQTFASGRIPGNDPFAAYPSADYQSYERETEFSRDDVAQELRTLRDLRRLSLDGSKRDPDVPQPSYERPLTSSDGSSPTDSVRTPRSPDDSDEVVSGDSVWVPANIHPEIAPQEWQSFVQKRGGFDQDDFPGVFGSTGIGRSLSRSKSLLSRQVSDVSADEYVDAGPELARRRSQRRPQWRISDVQRTPSRLSTHSSPDTLQAEEVPASATQTAGTQTDQPTEGDAPILVPPPGQILRRAARTGKGTRRLPNKKPPELRQTTADESSSSQASQPTHQQEQVPPSLTASQKSPLLFEQENLELREDAVRRTIIATSPVSHANSPEQAQPVSGNLESLPRRRSKNRYAHVMGPKSPTTDTMPPLPADWSQHVRRQQDQQPFITQSELEPQPSRQQQQQQPLAVQPLDSQRSSERPRLKLDTKSYTRESEQQDFSYQDRQPAAAVAPPPVPQKDRDARQHSASLSPTRVQPALQLDAIAPLERIPSSNKVNQEPATIRLVSPLEQIPPSDYEHLVNGARQGTPQVESAKPPSPIRETSATEQEQQPPETMAQARPPQRPGMKREVSAATLSRNVMNGAAAQPALAQKTNLVQQQPPPAAAPSADPPKKSGWGKLFSSDEKKSKTGTAATGSVKLKRSTSKESTSTATNSTPGDEQSAGTTGIFSSIFGGGKRKDKEPGGADTSPKRNQGAFSTAQQQAGHAAGHRQRSASPKRRTPQQSSVNVQPHFYTRYPIQLERAIYRMAHLKLSNSRRPLGQQVVLSNFMYGYLALIGAGHGQSSGASASAAAASSARQQQQQRAKAGIATVGQSVANGQLDTPSSGTPIGGSSADKSVSHMQSMAAQRQQADSIMGTPSRPAHSSPRASFASGGPGSSPQHQHHHHHQNSQHQRTATAVFDERDYD
ncbi:hypothetical protein PYCC9005_003697 [Savitreella phatthalungensis]